MRCLTAWILGCVVVVSTGCGGKNPSEGGLVGKWAVEDQVTVILEFTEDEEVQVTGSAKPLASAFEFAKVMDDFAVEPDSISIGYSLLGTEKLAIEADFTNLVVSLGDESMDAMLNEALDITVNQSELTVTSADGERLRLTRLR